MIDETKVSARLSRKRGAGACHSFWPDYNVPRARTDAEVAWAKFSVFSVLMADGLLEMIRPPVKAGDGRVFSPYLIHGGTINSRKASARVSLEMRFWRK